MFEHVPNPEALGVSSAGILAYLDALAASEGTTQHGLILLRHGKVVCDMAWGPYDRQTPHMLFSLSKSFTSTGVGFAIAEGKLRLEDRVSDILPDKLPENPSDDLLAITVDNLLCMGSGLDPRSDTNILGDDWAKSTLSYPVVHKPGTTFHYNSQGSHLLSIIVERVTGTKLRDYLVPRLFEPLGIGAPQWDEDPMGHTFGGWGLWLTTASISRFGQLLLQDGMWEGRQLLPEGWVKLATAKHIENGDPSQPSDWSQGYCYQYWRCQGGYFRGDGAFGQICMVCEDKDAVIAITAGLDDIQQEMNLLHQYLIPAIGAEPSDEATQQALKARIDALAYPYPTGGADASAFVGDYQNGEGQPLTIGMCGEALTICAKPAEGLELALHFANGAPQVHTANLHGQADIAYFSAYAVKDGVLEAAYYATSTPFHNYLRIIPEADGISIDFKGAPKMEKQRYKRVSNAG